MYLFVTFTIAGVLESSATKCYESNVKAYKKADPFKKLIRSYCSVACPFFYFLLSILRHIGDVSGKDNIRITFKRISVICSTSLNPYRLLFLWSNKSFFSDPRLNPRKNAWIHNLRSLRFSSTLASGANTQHNYSSCFTLNIEQLSIGRSYVNKVLGKKLMYRFVVLNYKKTKHAHGLIWPTRYCTYLWTSKVP